MRSAGGYAFAGLSESSEAEDVVWIGRATPSVVALTKASATSADSRFRLKRKAFSRCLAAGRGLHLIDHQGTLFRYEIDGTGANPPAALLPFDQLFEQRVTAALRLWRLLHGADPGDDPARLTPYQADRLTLSLRALDAKLEGSTYRQISHALSRTAILGPSWKTHDVRGTIVRLAKKGVALMQGGYRELLIHPYRRPPRKLSKRSNLNIR